MGQRPIVLSRIRSIRCDWIRLGSPELEKQSQKNMGGGHELRELRELFVIIRAIRAIRGPRLLGIALSPSFNYSADSPVECPG